MPIGGRRTGLATEIGRDFRGHNLDIRLDTMTVALIATEISNNSLSAIGMGMP